MKIWVFNQFKKKIFLCTQNFIPKSCTVGDVIILALNESKHMSPPETGGDICLESFIKKRAKIEKIFDCSFLCCRIFRAFGVDSGFPSSKNRFLFIFRGQNIYIYIYSLQWKFMHHCFFSYSTLNFGVFYIQKCMYFYFSYPKKHI